MTISHMDFLNELLSDSCPSYHDEDNREFVITLHCVEYTVQAQYNGYNLSKNRGEYSIVSYTKKDI